ncbi:DMT family transporter [Streptomyces sp. 6N223]|uniref:DMT family transporter n=1 Tax=Streptomyces sp. 6N223 TaxID=3457412 RepID=UPI003FCFDD0F
MASSTPSSTPSSTHAPTPAPALPALRRAPAHPRLAHAAGPLLVLAAAALWGTTGTAASFAPGAASPLSIGAATMGIGGLVTLALAGRSALAVLRDGRAALGWALLGALNVVVYPLAFYTAMDFAGVAVGTVVTIGCSPVFAALLERLVDGTGLSRRWLAATLAAVAGCTALVLTGDAEAGGDRIPAGVALGVLSGACYAAYAYCGARLIRRGHSSRATMGALFGLGSAVLVPVFAATGGGLVGEWRGVAVTAYLALVPMYLAYVLFGAGLARVTVSAATTLTLLEPVVAAVLGVAVVGERLGGWAWTGVGLVVVGLLVLTVRRRRQVS